MAMRSLDAFSIDVDGAPIVVGKGEILPEGHPVLKQLGDAVGNLFRPLAEDEPQQQQKPARVSRGAKGI